MYSTVVYEKWRWAAGITWAVCEETEFGSNFLSHLSSLCSFHILFSSPYSSGTPFSFFLTNYSPPNHSPFLPGLFPPASLTLDPIPLWIPKNTLFLPLWPGGSLCVHNFFMEHFKHEIMQKSSIMNLNISMTQLLQLSILANLIIPIYPLHLPKLLLLFFKGLFIRETEKACRCMSWGRGGGRESQATLLSVEPLGG